MPLVDEKKQPYGGSNQIGNVCVQQMAEVAEILRGDRETSVKTILPFVEWIAQLEIPGDVLRELRKGPANAKSGSISETNRAKLANAVATIRNNDIPIDSQEYKQAVKTITNVLKVSIGRHAALLGQVMDPTPRTTNKVYGLAGVKATRDTPVNVACANVVAQKLSLFLGQFPSLLIDFWSRRNLFALAVRENIRFGGKLMARRTFAHETLVGRNNALPEGVRLTKAKMRLLMQQMEAFAWPFDGAWKEAPRKGENDAVEMVSVTLPASKWTTFLEALSANLASLKAALGVDDLPTEVATLAATYLAQIDPRAALAVKSLGEQDYNTLLANIDLHHQNDARILKAAVGSLRTAPGDAALLAAKPELAETFNAVDTEANKFDASLGSALKLIKELV